MKRLVTIQVVLFIILINNHAQNYYVRSGANAALTGEDWENAYRSIPSTLVRGATYYIADGEYDGYYFDDPLDGQKYITIKKAIEGDHGTEVGWSSEYGNGTATFTSSMEFGTSYYIFDGQTGGGPDNWATGHGFEIITYWIELTTDGKIVYFFDNISNIEVKHTKLHTSVPFRGFGTAFYGMNNSNILISYCYVYDLYGYPLFTEYVNNYTIEYSYFYRNESTLQNRSGFNSDIGSDNMTFRFNKFKEIDGTAIFTGANGAIENPHDSWDIYGNICVNSTHFVYYDYETGINEDIARYWKIYNNTIVGPRGGNIEIQNGQDIEIVNNIWSNFYGEYITDVDGTVFYTDGRISFYYDINSTYNSLFDVFYSYELSNFINGRDYESTDNQNNEKLASLPFKNLSDEDFYLKEEGSAGQSLPEPYNVDMYGYVRGNDGHWDRGALEYDIAIGNKILSGSKTGIYGYAVYPNPFRENSLLIYELSQAANIEITLYNMQGKLVGVLFKGFLHAGSHQQLINGEDLQAGVYYYSISSEEFKVGGKCFLAK